MVTQSDFEIVVSGSVFDGPEGPQILLGYKPVGFGEADEFRKKMVHCKCSNGL
jgi:hypothetical protein